MRERVEGLSRETPVGFIGAGRLGSSLAIAMARSRYRVVAVSSRRPTHRAWLADQLPGAFITGNGQDVANVARVVFITTTDSAIEEVARSINWRDDQAVIHCSGAAPLGLLDSAVSEGSAVAGFHPLQTFPAPDAADSFRDITFGIEAADMPLKNWLDILAVDLGGNPIIITADQRPAYHAAAVMACGLMAGLTGLAAEVWASSGGISRDEAINSLAPLVKSTANWIREKGLPEALTGPYVRGDVTTVRSHVEATSAVSSQQGAAYSALALAALHLAKEQGGLTAEAESSIKEILTTALRASCEIIDGA